MRRACSRNKNDGGRNYASIRKLKQIKAAVLAGGTKFEFKVGYHSLWRAYMTSMRLSEIKLQLWIALCFVLASIHCHLHEHRVQPSFGWFLDLEPGPPQDSSSQRFTVRIGPDGVILQEAHLARLDLQYRAQTGNPQGQHIQHISGSTRSTEKKDGKFW